MFETTNQLIYEMSFTHLLRSFYQIPTFPHAQRSKVLVQLLPRGLSAEEDPARPRRHPQNGWFILVYPLVNIQKTMENHHFEWENPLFLWPFSMSLFVCLPGRVVQPPVISVPLLNALRQLGTPEKPARFFGIH